MNLSTHSYDATVIYLAILDTRHIHHEFTAVFRFTIFLTFDHENCIHI